MDMTYVNRDFRPVKLNIAVNWMIHSYQHSKNYKPYAIFYGGNVYEWGLTWEALASEDARISIVILLRPVDKDREAISLPTKVQDVLEVGRSTNS